MSQQISAEAAAASSEQQEGNGQLSEEEFRQAADFVIDNSTTLEETYRQIDEKLEAYTWRE